jgi:hypothetical protein
LWLLSTPKGTRRFFCDTLEIGGDRWFGASVPAPQNPALFRKPWAEEKETLGERWLRQAYVCECVDATAGLFAGEDPEVFVCPEILQLGD